MNLSVRALLAATAVAVVLGVPAAAAAQSASPAPEATPSVPKGATVSGEVSGAVERGSTLVMSVDATMPGGWEGLHLVEVVLRSGGEELDRIRYDIEDRKLTLGEQSIVTGTGAVATGSYIKVSGTDVKETSGAGDFSFEVEASVIQALPEDVRFPMIVTDDRGDTAQTSATLEEPPGEGLTWGTVIAFVAVALFAGGFVGNLMASRRRPTPRASIYGTIQRRLGEDTASTPGGR